MPAVVARRGLTLALHAESASPLPALRPRDIEPGKNVGDEQHAADPHDPASPVARKQIVVDKDERSRQRCRPRVITIHENLPRAVDADAAVRVRRIARDAHVIAIGRTCARPDRAQPRARTFGQVGDRAFDRGKIGLPMRAGDERIPDFPMKNDQHAGQRLHQPECRRRKSGPAVPADQICLQRHPQCLPNGHLPGVPYACARVLPSMLLS